MAVTIQQIAERAGVSRGTVDRALNHRGRINPEVAEKICRLADEMGYVQKERKRSRTAKDERLKIGVVTQLARSSFMQEVNRGIEKAAQELKEKGIQMGDIKGSDEEADAEEEEDFDENNERTKHVSVLNLILPLVCIVIALLATGLNCFTAFAIAVIFTGFLYVMQGLQTISEYVQCIVDGFIDMVDMVIILMLGYAMQECMYAMGMEDFVSAVCGAIPVASLLPFIFFVFFSCSEYLFSLNYTLYQIAIPVMMVVLPGVGANVPLCLGAIISAGLFGANACVVSDLGVVSARACRVTIYDQYRTSQPYVLIAGAISAALYLAAGFIF